MSHPVVMGKNTWLSIGKTLEGRTNIILTHDPEFRIPGCITVNSIEEVLSTYSEEDVFVIGGAETFRQFLPYTNKMYITRIQNTYSGETYFPYVNWDEWEIVFYETVITESGFPISFERWIRKSILS